jgi:hypothetical protein
MIVESLAAGALRLPLALVVDNRHDGCIGGN